MAKKEARNILSTAVGSVVLLFVFLVPTAVHATTTTTTTNNYTDISKGFRLQVPDGWVVDEINKTDPSISQHSIPTYGIEYLIAMCPQDIALPAPGRLYTCPFPLPPNAIGAFQLYRFVDLQDRPELAALVQQGEPITTDDLLALYIDYQRNITTFYDPYFQGIQLVTDEDTEVSIVDPQNNNQTVGTAQAKFVEYTDTDSSGSVSYKESALLVLSSDANMGYVVRPQVLQLSNQELPGFATQVINSFELIAASGPGEMDDAVNLE